MAELQGQAPPDKGQQPPPGGGGESHDLKAARKAAKKAAKEQKRLQRAGDAGADLGRKPCTLCGRARDLLVRCQADASGRWHMACGRCWAAASGGRVDGAPGAPHYRYGGLWKNHHAVVSGKRRVPKSASSPGSAAGAGASQVASQGSPQQVAAAVANAAAAHAAESGADLERLLLEEAAACEYEGASDS